jgi:hypothetical protein
MRKAAFLLFALFCAAPAFAQVGFKSTNVWFSNMDVGGDPNGLHYVTLVDASNNTSSFSTGVLTVYSATGTAMPVSFDGQAPAASLNFELDSGVVRQIQISSTGEITQGWIQITYTPNLAETTVIVQYLGGSSILSEVGINPFFNNMTDTTLGPATVFPVETNLSSSLNTGIAIANPNTAQVVRVQLLSAGMIVGTTAITLPQYGYTAKLLTELFPNVSGISQMTAEVGLTSCTTTACTALGPGLIATALRLNIATGLFTAVPVVPTPLGGEVVRNIPHIAFGGSPPGINFQTVLYLTNPTSSAVFGTANLFDNNGNPIAATANGGATPLSSFPFSALPGSVFKITLSGGSALQSGWLQLTQSDGTIPLIVNALFQTYNGPTVISEADVLESPAFPEGLIYVHLTPGITNVGVALANPQSTPNTVTLTLYNLAGFTDTSFQYVVTLPPFGHLAQYVTEMFPQLAGTSLDGTLSMQSGSGFSSVALRQNGASVVGFAALPVSQGVIFVPSITNIQITSTTRFNGGTVSFIISVADYSSSLVFPAASPVVEAAEWAFYPNTNQQDGAYGFELDGSPMINAQTGTLTGTFQSENANAIPSGTPAVFYIDIIDSLDNYSNVISIPFKF